MKKSIVALGLGTALLLSGCVGYPSHDKGVTIQILNRDSEVVREIKADDYSIDGDDLRYMIGKKSYILSDEVPHIIVGEIDDEDDD